MLALCARGEQLSRSAPHGRRRCGRAARLGILRPLQAQAIAPPMHGLPHLILFLKPVSGERYPTFADALRDLDDALCLVFLFASLVPRLAGKWPVWHDPAPA